ncbi:MAG TPA: isoprenyl transferase [Lachnospiraceae bacterium]|nr:isoprenyl transferase [Lachnospiraceae bacterium]
MQEQEVKIPSHIAIILDGNGRWAKKRNMPRNYGHTQGSKTVEKICEDAYKIGVKYLTVYAFSTENWKRPKDEVDAIMKLLRSYLQTSKKTAKKNNMRVRILGDKTGLSEDIKKSIDELEEVSRENTGLNLQVAINYGGRDEIIRAVKALSLDIKKNTIAIDNIDEKAMENYMDTKGIPDPDLLIRTSGEKRLSNFLLWQLAYTEFYFTDVLWPDFDKKELMKAIEYYNSRVRRFGAIS